MGQLRRAPERSSLLNQGRHSATLIGVKPNNFTHPNVGRMPWRFGSPARDLGSPAFGQPATLGLAPRGTMDRPMPVFCCRRLLACSD
jgi:hypothetical protein